MSKKYPEYYSDFDIAFRRNAMTGDIIRKKDLEDVKQSLGLLLQTRFYSRCWHPEIGSYLPTLLFNQDDDYIKKILEEQIETLISNYEPRIELIGIDIDHKTMEDVFNGRITIRLEYKVILMDVLDTFVYTINRLR